MKQKSKEGFSLVEMLIALAASSFSLFYAAQRHQLAYNINNLSPADSAVISNRLIRREGNITAV